jgi:hypothetical protein
VYIGRTEVGALQTPWTPCIPRDPSGLLTNSSTVSFPNKTFQLWDRIFSTYHSSCLMTPMGKERETLLGILIFHYHRS